MRRLLSKVGNTHTQRDGLIFTHTPTICYDSCTYGNSNIICIAQVGLSVRIIQSFFITKNYNNETALKKITNARRLPRSV